MNEVSIELEKGKVESLNLYYIFKRCIDVVIGFIGVLLMLPIIILVKVLYVLSGDFNSIFFKQERIGKNRKIFIMYKFRTMIPNADEILFKLLKEDKEAKEQYFKYKKLKNDPRVTKIGNFLRRTSLDEFPQFINILKGDMSLVGPRPYLPREKEDMGQHIVNIVKSKPGLTGYWQVNGRSNTSFKERLILDEYYEKHKSFILDLKIVIKTIKQVIFKEGI